MNCFGFILADGHNGCTQNHGWFDGHTFIRTQSKAPAFFAFANLIVADINVFAVTFSGLLFQLTTFRQNRFFRFIRRHIVVNTINGIDLTVGTF